MATISSYRNYEEEARGLVQQLLSTSLERIRQELEDRKEPGGESLTGRDFTVEKGQNALERMVEEWSVGDSWKHCIDFLGQRGELFTYCVQWSEPTRRRPVPTATACVYFYILAQEQSSRVLVFYVLEGQRLVHRPGKTAFQEVWLRNVIDNKLAITQSVCQ